jgi:amino acid transporter
MIGLRNYVTAVGNLAYVIAFFMGIGALVAVFFIVKRILKMKRKHDDQPWLAILPGLLIATTVFGFLNWFYRALPEVLDIAFKVRGLERDEIVFVDLLAEALRAESVLPAWRIFYVDLSCQCGSQPVYLACVAKPEKFQLSSLFFAGFYCPGRRYWVADVHTARSQCGVCISTGGRRRSGDLAAGDLYYQRRAPVGGGAGWSGVGLKSSIQTLVFGCIYFQHWYYWLVDGC